MDFWRGAETQMLRPYKGFQVENFMDIDEILWNGKSFVPLFFYPKYLEQW